MCIPKPPPPPPPDTSPPPPPPPPPSEPKSSSSGFELEKKQYPLFAGIIMLIISVCTFLSIALSVFFRAFPSFFSFHYYSYGYDPISWAAGIVVWICWSIFWVFTGGLAIMALIGAVFSFTKKNWVIALVGAICSVFISGFVTVVIPNFLCCLHYFVGAAFFALSIVSIALIALSKDEFKK